MATKTAISPKKVFAQIEAQTRKNIEFARKARRAQLGLLSTAIGGAQDIFGKSRGNTGDIFSDFVVRGENLQADAKAILPTSPKQLGSTLTEARENYLRELSKLKAKYPWMLLSPFTKAAIAKVEAKDEAEKAIKKAKKKTAAKVKKAPSKAKKAGAKKTVAKKTTAAKKASTAKAANSVEIKASEPAVKAETVKVEATKAEAVNSEAVAAKPIAQTTERHIPFLADIKRYDADASEAIVKKIVNHLGIALTNNDAKYVACSDESERATVRDSWLVRKLAVEGSTADLDARVMEICEKMQEDRMKNRVTFYYLLAQKAGKLSAI